MLQSDQSISGRFISPPTQKAALGNLFLRYEAVDRGFPNNEHYLKEDDILNRQSVKSGFLSWM